MSRRRQIDDDGRSLLELLSYRSTILAFAERDVRVRYKQAVFGFGWAIIQPLTFMIVFTIALGRGVGVSGSGAPYAAFALATLVPWTYLQNAITFGSNALVTDGPLLRKVYFPREVPVLGAVLSSGLDLAAGVILFALLGPLLGAKISVTWLYAIPLAGCLILLAAAVSLLTSGLNVYYRDLRYAIPFALQCWLFASPIAYPVSVFPAKWRLLYAALNPAVGIFDGFRRSLTRAQSPDPILWAMSMASIVILMTIAYRTFKRIEPHFADVV